MFIDLFRADVQVQRWDHLQCVHTRLRWHCVPSPLAVSTAIHDIPVFPTCHSIQNTKYYEKNRQEMHGHKKQVSIKAAL